jgi:two-component system, NarL family, nitrate/nitrite response regulator NarL
VSAPFELTVQDGPLEKGRTMDEAAMPQDSKKVRVVVADDHPLYREGVVRALSSSGQIDVVAEAEDGHSALSEIEHHQPDVALLDYKLPGLDGLAIMHAEIRLRASNDAPVLTKRESEILRLIASGKSLPEIAGELYLGVTTVKTHVQHLYEKLGVSDRAAAVAEAMRRGLIE